jgi:hypothetical protein
VRGTGSDLNVTIKANLKLKHGKEMPLFSLSGSGNRVSQQQSSQESEMQNEE